MKHRYLQPEDYFENDCLLCMNNNKNYKLPIQRILEKIDDCYSRCNFKEAEKILLFWLDEANQNNDLEGKLVIYNELMGHYRKEKNADKALLFVDITIELVKILSINNTTILGTTYVNIATVYKVFDKPKDAINYYEKALHIYMLTLKNNDERFAGLYNNYALALMDINDYDRSCEYFTKAIAIMEKSTNSILNAAISYLNLADAIVKKQGLLAAEDQINTYILKSWTIINDNQIMHDGYYAYVCDKCASGFDYFGYFLYAIELRKRAKDIYERP